MENSLKGLLLAAGTIITCIVIGLGFYIARSAKDTAASGAGQIGKLNAEFSESDKVIYDGMTVTGSEVVNALNRFRNDEIAIKVTTNKGTTCYGKTLSADNSSLSGDSNAAITNTGKPADSAYINPNAQFAGSVVRDENDAIIGIVFVQHV